jgi:YD repeat-containing protein
VVLFFAALAAATAHASETTTYSYDPLGRLSGASSSAGPQVSTGYDPAGNRSNYTVTGALSNATFSVNSASAAEGGAITFTITKGGTAGGSLNVSFATSNGSAVAGSDYTAASGTLTFLASETVKTVAVLTTDDSQVESAETFSFTLSNPSPGSQLATATGTGTINDNDNHPPPSFAVADPAQVAEGGTLAFVVTKTGATTSSYSVNYATANGTAAAGSDFTTASGTLTFTTAETSKTINVATTDDASVESAETVVLNLSGATGGATITRSPASGTIIDNDSPPPPSFAVSDPSPVTEGGNLIFTVTKAGATTSSFSVNYATANGTAAAGSDFTAASGTLTFTTAETSKTISVATTNDSSVESAETVLLNLSGATGGATITRAQGSGTVNDNDTYPPPSFAISSAAAVTEGGTLVYTVTKTSPVSFAYSVNYATANGSAAAGSDYNATSGTLSFAVGETSKTISVGTIDDGSVESAETVLVNLSGPTGGATISAAQGSGTINDNDTYPPPGFAISGAAAVNEGGTLVYTVTKTSPVSFAYSVNYATANGSAAAGSDYGSTSGTLTFAVGETSKTISVATVDDGSVESAETVLVNLSSPTGGATISTSQGSGTINDNDTYPPPSFSISGAAAVTEGGTLVYTVTKTNPVSFAYSVDYSTANGSAAAGSDYNATSGTLSFAVGETSKTISVVTIDDGTYEPPETVLVNLSNASGGATIAGPQGSGTINDNDVPPNNPPTPVNNTGSQPRCTVRTYNVVANDTDPDGDYPLSLVSVSGSTGGIFSVVDSQTIQFESFGTTGTRVGTYTVQDSRGATATATLTISVTSGTCF